MECTDMCLYTPQIHSETKALLYKLKLLLDGLISFQGLRFQI